MSVPVRHRYAANLPAGDDVAVTRDLGFPQPRFPSGVAVPPAVLLVVLLGAAGCLVALYAQPGAASGSAPIATVTAVAAGLAVTAAALFGFVTLRALVVKPVRRLRTELVAAASGTQQRRRSRPSAVREIARIGTAVGSQPAKPSTGRAWRAPMTAGLVLVAIVPLWALALSVALVVTRQPANVAGSTEPSLVILVAAVSGGTVLLILGYVYVATVRPLQHLAGQAEAMAFAGDGQRAPEPVAPQRLDEVGAIAAGLNRLLTATTQTTAHLAAESVSDGHSIAATGRGSRR